MEESDFAADQKIWLSWYEENKCTMTSDQAEEIFANVREPFPDYDDPKVLEQVKDKIEESDRDLPGI